MIYRDHETILYAPMHWYKVAPLALAKCSLTRFMVIWFSIVGLKIQQTELPGVLPIRRSFEIGLPPVIIHFHRIFHKINHLASLGSPNLRKPPEAPYLSVCSRKEFSQCRFQLFGNGCSGQHGTDQHLTGVNLSFNRA